MSRSIDRKGAYNEQSRKDHSTLRTISTALKNRLNELAKGYPDCCQVLDVDPDTDCTEFSVQKGRLCFRVTKPYTKEGKKLLSDYARQHGIQEYQQKL